MISEIIPFPNKEAEIPDVAIMVDSDSNPIAER
jgi:hypothetical protein